MKKWRAFTLVELLVVVAIIGILATVVVISYSGAQKKARDARRSSDINQIQTALTLADNDAGGGYSNYPNVGGSCITSNASATCWNQPMMGTGTTYFSGNAALITFLSPYLPNPPQDPLAGSRPWADAYVYLRGSWWYNSCGGQSSTTGVGIAYQKDDANALVPVLGTGLFPQDAYTCIQNSVPYSYPLVHVVATP